jgi:uncharacterized hydrophobic protein (TIGR00271 family)
MKKVDYYLGARSIEMPSESIDYRLSVCQSIEDNSSLTIPYLVMNILATIVACYGLIADSTAVVIGAMIIAMLLGPIVGVAMGLVEGNNQLLYKAILAEVAGVATVLIVAAIIGKIHQDVPLGKEIFSRTTPNILDLAIALAGGAAGAYATISPKLSVGLVGVAISTALVPPLSTCSILLVRGETQLATGAFLLFFANLVAIQVASSVVLWLHGYHKIANGDLGLKRLLLRNTVSFGLLISLVGLLGLNFQTSLAKQHFEQNVRKEISKSIIGFPGTFVTDVRFTKDDKKNLITAVLTTPIVITPQSVATLEAKLSKLTDQPLELIVRSVSTRVINKSGYVYDDRGQTEQEKSIKPVPEKSVEPESEKYVQPEPEKS